MMKMTIAHVMTFRNKWSPPQNCRAEPAAASDQFVLSRLCPQHSSAYFCRPMTSYPRPPYGFSEALPV